MQPFDADTAHPAGGPRLLARQKVDGRADAKGHRRQNLIAMSMHPQFLFGSAQADDQHVGPRGGNHLHKDLILPRILFKSQRRAIGPDHVHGRPALFDILRGTIGHAGSRSQQKHAQPFRRGGIHGGEQGRHQIAPRHALWKLAAQHPRRHEYRKTVGQYQRGIGVGLPQRCLLLEHHRMIDIGRHHVVAVAVAFAHPGKQSLDGLRHPHGVDCHAEQLNGRHRVGTKRGHKPPSPFDKCRQYHRPCHNRKTARRDWKLRFAAIGANRAGR